jgi:hypothetical protein
MSNILDSFTISQVCNGNEADASHLMGGDFVAITDQGLKEHNNHNTRNSIGLAAGVGIFALPALIGGGVGIAMGGEAIGLGLAELGIVGGAAGAAGAKVLDKPVKGYRRDDKHAQIALVDMIGTVITKTRRWWDMPGHDVKIRWVGADEYGNRISFTAQHNPEHIVKLKKA